MTKRGLWYLLAALAALTAFWGMAAYSNSIEYMIAWFSVWALIAIVLLAVGMRVPAAEPLVQHNNRAAMPDNYTAIDLLTTGPNPTKDRIFEFAAVRVRHGETVSKMSMLVNPGKPLPKEVAQRTGITDATLARQPEVVVGLKQFLDFVGSDTLVAPNVDLDQTFLEVGAQRHGLRLPENSTVDTLALDHEIFPQDTKYSMDDMIHRCNSKRLPVDRALANAEQTVCCYEWFDQYVNRNEISMKAVANGVE